MTDSPSWQAEVTALIAIENVKRKGLFPGTTMPSLSEVIWSKSAGFREEVETMAPVLARLDGFDPDQFVGYANDWPVMSDGETIALEPRDPEWTVAHLFRPAAFDAVAESGDFEFRFPRWVEFERKREWALERVRRGVPFSRRAPIDFGTLARRSGKTIALTTSAAVRAGDIVWGRR